MNFFRSDIPTKQFLLHLDQEWHFVIADLDDTHIFMNPQETVILKQPMIVFNKALHFSANENDPG